MSIRDRITKVFEECDGVWGVSGITSWERERLEEWKDRDYLTEKQEAVLQAIENKAFGRNDG